MSLELLTIKFGKKELEAGKIDLSKVKIIYQTPGYPDYNFTARGDLDKQFGEGFTKKNFKQLF